MLNSYIKLLLMPAMLMLAACGGPLTVNSNESSMDKDLYPIEGLTVSFAKEQNISLENVYHQAKKVTINISVQKWHADLRQYTQTAWIIIRHELEKRGIKVNGGNKHIRLKIYNVEASPGWTIDAKLKLEAQLSNGVKITHSGSHKSSKDVWHAVDQAIVKAITKLLTDKTFQAFINN